jgi:hypothetical protein
MTALEFYDNAQLQGNAYGKIKRGVLTWKPRSETDQESADDVIAHAEAIRAYCAAHREREYIIGTDAMPRCTCPFAMAYHATARVALCALYGAAYDWAYFDKEDNSYGLPERTVC